MSRKRSALSAMAERGTQAEKAVAKAKLKSLTESNGVTDVPALPSDDNGRAWIPQSELRQATSDDPTKEAYRYIYSMNIKHFLDNITEGVPFDRYAIPAHRVVFTPDKYLAVVSWLKQNNLVTHTEKSTRMYILESKQAVKDAWNAFVERSKLS